MTAECAVNPMTVQRTNETVRYMQSGHHETKQCIFLILKYKINRVAQIHFQTLKYVMLCQNLSNNNILHAVYACFYFIFVSGMRSKINTAATFFFQSSVQFRY